MFVDQSSHFIDGGTRFREGKGPIDPQVQDPKLGLTGLQHMVDPQ